MRMRVGLAMVLVGACGCAWGSEPSCYRSSAEAAAQTGVRGVEGYRLETVRRDVFSGAVWATVKSCGHPERPGVMLLASVGTGLGGGISVGMARRSEIAADRVLVMLAGTRVRFVETDENARMEMSAVAQSSGAVGDRVRVRLLPVSSDGGSDGATSWASSERFATGIVRSRDLVEMETR
jgi:hypothetical protein